MVSKPFDRVRTGKFAAAVKDDGCSSAATKVVAPTTRAREALEIVDIVVLDGDHEVFQPGRPDKAPTADCIVFVLVRRGTAEYLLQVLVELKAGSLSVSNVREKFATSWSHAEKVRTSAALPPWAKASLHVLGDKLHKEDRRALETEIKHCKGHTPKFHSGDRPLAELLPAV